MASAVLRHLRPLVSPVVDLAASRRLEAALNIADLRLAAERRMHPMCFGYLDSGADDEVTLRRNKDAFSALELHYSVLSGTSPESLDLSTSLLGGLRARVPFLCCPCAGQRMFHTEGERGAARAAAEVGAAYSLSTLATTRPADLSREVFSSSAGGGGGGEHPPKIFQLYVWKDRSLVRDMMQQAKAAGFQALALTVDLTWYGNRERDHRNGFTVPPQLSVKQVVGALRRPAWTWDFLSTPPYTYALLDSAVPAQELASFVTAQLAPDFTWDDAAWIAQEWGGPALLKGVVRPDEAQRAVRDCGFSGVWVSNHGGRQLDGAPAPVDLLPAMRAAVGPGADIIVDGGVQRGTDILKALALGADAVGVGKPYLYGLGAGGAKGALKALRILETELRRAMGLLGVHTVDELKRRGPTLVKRRDASPRDAQGARDAEAGII